MAAKPWTARDWCWRILAGSTAGLTLAFFVPACFALAGDGIMHLNKYQVAMWMVPPLWVAVVGIGFSLRTTSRAGLIKTYKQVHTWTGLLSGLALFVAFYAGAITMFKEPIARWSAPQASLQTTLPQLPALIDQVMAAHPAAARAFVVELAADPSGAAALHWQEPGAAGKPPGAGTTFSARQETDGTLQVDAVRQSRIGQFVDELHRTAGLPTDLESGVLVMAVISGLYALALVSGVVVLWPTLIKDFFALRWGANLKRLWLDAHNVIGIVSLPFHVTMALSAMVFGLHDPIYAVQDRLVYDGQLARMYEESSPMREARAGEGARAMLPVADLLARVREQEPGVTPLRLTYRHYGQTGATVWLQGRDDRQFMRKPEGGFLLVSAETGQVLNREYGPGGQGWMRWVTGFFALHFGSYGGEPVRWGYFVLGLAGAFLFYTGNLLWIESRRKRARGASGNVTQRRDVRAMGALTVGACMGCIAGVSVAIAAARFVEGPAWALYYLTFLGFTGAAFALGPARAATALPRAAAAATLAIPAATLLAWALSGWNAQVALSAPGVDAVALAGTALLWRTAVAARRRARNGPQDSIWASG